MANIWKLVETTQWSDNTPNMIYYMSDGRLLGYQKDDHSPFRPFTSKLFDQRRRTFVKSKVKSLPA